MISSLLLLLLRAACTSRGTTFYADKAPSDQSLNAFLQWIVGVDEYRTAHRKQLGSLLDASYGRNETRWASTSFVQPQCMVHDRFLFDRATESFTVDRYLDDLQQRYGGIDSVLLWQMYPNIG